MIGPSRPLIFPDNTDREQQQAATASRRHSSPIQRGSLSEKPSPAPALPFVRSFAVARSVAVHTAWHDKAQSASIDGGAALLVHCGFTLPRMQPAHVSVNGPTALSVVRDNKTSALPLLVSLSTCNLSNHTGRKERSAPCARPLGMRSLASALVHPFRCGDVYASKDDCPPVHLHVVTPCERSYIHTYTHTHTCLPLLSCPVLSCPVLSVRAVCVSTPLSTTGGRCSVLVFFSSQPANQPVSGATRQQKKLNCQSQTTQRTNERTKATIHHPPAHRPPQQTVTDHRQ